MQPKTLRPSIDELRHEQLEPTEQLLIESLIHSLTFQSRINDPRHRVGESKREAVAAYTECRHSLNSRYQSLQTFLKQVVELNTHTYGDPSRKKDMQRLQQQARQHLPYLDWQYEADDILCAETMSHPIDDIQEQLNSSLEMEAARLVQELFQTLRDAVDRNELGLLSWSANAQDVCVYHYFRTIISQQKIGERYTTNSERRVNGRKYEIWEIQKEHSTFNEQIVYERHEHHLYDSKIWPWPANGLQKPSYITALLRQVPKWLQPHVFVVSGEMCREEIKATSLVDRTFEQESNVLAHMVASGNLLSPAVVLSDIVLAGWADRDLLARPTF